MTKSKTYNSSTHLRYRLILYFCIVLIGIPVFSLAADFRFVVMADSRGSSNGVNTAELGLIMSRITALNPQPQFIVFPGDMINGSSNTYSTITSQLQTWKNTVTAYGKPATFFYPGVGNHETNSGASYASETAFKDVFTEFTVTDPLAGYNKTVYSFDYDNSRFIMLNSNHISVNDRIDATQRSWLTTKLTGKTHYFVFCHDPAYPTGAHVGSSLDASTTDRDAFWQIADNANVTMVFVGHEHNYTRRHIDNAFNAAYHNNIYQITTGSCGAPLTSTYSSILNVDVAPIDQYHFAVVDVSGSNVSVHVYKDDMIQIDYFTVSRTVPTSCIDFWATSPE